MSLPGGFLTHRPVFGPRETRFEIYTRQNDIAASFSPSRPTLVFPRKSLFYLLHCHLSSILKYTTGLKSEHRTRILVRI